MKMIYPNRTVLRHLRALSKGSSVPLTLISDAPTIALFDNLNEVYDYTKFQKEISAILFGLNRDGYLEFIQKPYQFYITDKGLHPYRKTWEEIKKFLLKSVFIPIVVSVATTLLTLCIKELLQWLSQH